MKKLLFIALLCIGSLAQAQEYDTSIGIRGGIASGLTIKHFISYDAALEGIISTRWGGINLSALYEIHAPAFHEPGFNWYYGFGAHLGFWNGNNANWGEENKNYTALGVAGIIGLEYIFSEVPINLSLDYTPSFYFNGPSGIQNDNFALSIRYIF